MQKRLSRNGLYVLLLPTFFVIHGFVQNFGLIDFKSCLLLLTTYFAAAAVIYLLGWLFYRNHLKASLLTGFLFFLYLFFGAIDDFFKAHLFFLSRYIIIMPLYFLSICILIIYLKKTHSRFDKLTFFINVLLLIYLLFDAVDLAWKSIHPNTDKLSIYRTDKMNPYWACDSCKNPDIYFLLFDEYTSTTNLKQSFNYDNSGLDSFLLQRGFSIQSNSQSNYNFTPFSMASILNMNYIKGIKNVNACTIQDYANCNSLIRNNEVIRFLSSRQYDMVNYSIFDLAGNPSLIETSLLPVKTRLITEQTLFNRMIHDIGWNLYMGKFEIKWLSKNTIYEASNNNNRIFDWLHKESKLKTGRSRFVYAHFEMPHPPFYFDKNFQPRDEKDLIAEKNIEHVDAYKGYLPYTNSKLKELVDTIQKNTVHSAVIILMGDHGYRTTMGNTSHSHHFKILNAVYFPDQAYQFMTDSLTGVNQFRAIFNTLFDQHLPLLKDSSIFLTDQP